jgi:hypothetical protein
VERLERGVKEVRDLKELMFKHNQELFALRTAERNIIAEIAGGQAQNKNLGVKVRVFGVKTCVRHAPSQSAQMKQPAAPARDHWAWPHSYPEFCVF